MATKIAFYFEDLRTNVSSGWPDAVMERWKHNAKAGAIDALCMIDDSTYKVGQYYKHIDANIGFEYAISLEEVEAANPTATFVYFERPETLVAAGITPVMLNDLVHPDATSSDVIYVVGADSKSVPIAGRESALWVSIPAAAGEMYWAEEAAGVVIWDRYFKNLA